MLDDHTANPIMEMSLPSMILLLESVYISRMLAIGEHARDERFMWFGSLERNTLRLHENMSCIAVCCLSVG
jgi:hypothetical protein